MNAFVTAGAGFLLAVLWFDLMFDVQASRQREGELPDDALSSISAYYARVTTAARPMNRLISVVMLATTAGIVVEISSGKRPVAAWASLALALSAILLAALRTVPSAVRLGARQASATKQSDLARAVLRQHIICFACITALVAIQLAAW